MTIATQAQITRRITATLFVTQSMASAAFINITGRVDRRRRAERPGGTGRPAEHADAGRGGRDGLPGWALYIVQRIVAEAERVLRDRHATLLR